jgi:hypothetical protein
MGRNLVSIDFSIWRISLPESTGILPRSDHILGTAH